MLHCAIYGAMAIRRWSGLMLTALVLVCSLTVTHDLRECDQSNAVDVLILPEDSGNPATCFMHGQAYLAQTEIGQQLTEDERVKVVCAPTGKVAARAHPAVIR
jgi:hypothetical protein